MADATGAGGYYPPGGNYGPGYGSGYGMTLYERLHRCVGTVITVYVGEESVPVMGTLHAVGPNFLELHRATETNAHEAVIIPLQAVTTIVIPMQHTTMKMPPQTQPGV